MVLIAVPERAHCGRPISYGQETRRSPLKFDYDAC